MLYARRSIEIVPRPVRYRRALPPALSREALSVPPVLSREALPVWSGVEWIGGEEVRELGQDQYRDSAEEDRGSHGSHRCRGGRPSAWDI